MCETIRKIHLYTGLTLLMYVVMYFVTGYIMIHEKWFPDRSPSKSVRREPLPHTEEKSPEDYAIYLQEQFDLRGKRASPQQLRDGRWRFRYFRPGVSYEATISSSRDSVQITRSEEGFRGLMVGFHRLHGYGGGWLYDLWALTYDLANLAMILFAISGIYMWYRLTRRRWPGWAVLGLSFSYATATVLHLVYAP